MGRTPKNLKKALEKKDKGSSNQSFDDIFGDWSSFHDLDYNECVGSTCSDLTLLIYDLAKIHIGKTHSSDLLDESSEEEILQFLKKEQEVKRKATEDSSDDFDESSSFFDKYDLYEDIKTAFQNKMADSIESLSFLDLDSFVKLYNKLKIEDLFSGTKEDLEKVLKGSPNFRKFAQELVTRYTG